MSFTVGNKYRFSIHNTASSILGNIYINMEVVGSGKAELFYAYATDIYTTHETLKQVIPNLPNIKDCMFFLFKDTYGEFKVFSDQYILTSSIETSSLVNIVITIPNVDSSLPLILSNEIKRLGVNNAKIELI